MSDVSIGIKNGRDLSKLTYAEWLDSPEWAAIKAAVFERDAHRCVMCNSPEDLEVHHRHYPRKREKVQLSDLTLVCRLCHQLFSDRIKLWEKY